MKPLGERKKMVDRESPKLTVSKQCNLLNICRSSLYYKVAKTSDLNLKLMRKIDEHYLIHPYKGAPSMHVYLTKDLGYRVSRNRVERLYYKQMGLRSIQPGPHTSKRHKDHKIYPYLLRDLKIERPGQVWGMDITYIPMEKGFMYLSAIIDLYSRYVVGWSLSNTMDAEWCAELYRDTVKHQGAPEIINTDQGSQFTSKPFTDAVSATTARLSMDGKGRATDNAFIERLWRSVKYENVYIQAYETPKDLYRGLEEYFDHYNHKRRHSSIDHRFPQELYAQQRETNQLEEAA